MSFLFAVIGIEIPPMLLPPIISTKLHYGLPLAIRGPTMWIMNTLTIADTACDIQMFVVEQQEATHEIFL